MSNEYIQNSGSGDHRKPKKKRTGLKVTAGVLAVVVIGAVVMNGGGDEDKGDAGSSAVEAADSDAPEGDAAQQFDGHTLTFRASTSDGSTGSVTYLGEDAQITQRQDEPMPWSVDLPGIDDKWDVLGANVSVQQNGSGEVTCEVLWDGEQVATNTSSGPYSIAMCSLPTEW